MDVILFSTAAVRDMFDSLEQGVQPAPADPEPDGQPAPKPWPASWRRRRGARRTVVVEPRAPVVAPWRLPPPLAAVGSADDGLDWNALSEVVTGTP